MRRLLLSFSLSGFYISDKFSVFVCGVYSGLERSILSLVTLTFAPFPADFDLDCEFFFIFNKDTKIKSNILLFVTRKMAIFVNWIRFDLITSD